MIDLSIIIVNWNTCDQLMACLASIQADISLREQLESEIIVVDNGSSDGSVAMVQELFPQVRLICNPKNRGFAAANNQAIRQSHGRYLLLLNSDASLESGTVLHMTDFLDNNPQVGIVGAKLVNPDGTFQASYAKFPNLLRELMAITGLAKLIIGPNAPSPRPKKHERARRVDWVSGAALMARGTTVKKVGLLDEGYFLYSEETDWCYRVNQAGYQVWYLPSVRIVHHSGISTQKQPIINYTRLYTSKVRFFAHNYNLIQAKTLNKIYVVMAVVRIVFWRLVCAAYRSKTRQASYQLRIRQEQALIKSLNEIKIYSWIEPLGFL